jgi:hypothetical protein
LLQWMWSKSSFYSTFFFFIFGSIKLLVTMNVIKIIILQHILLLHLWIHQVTCYNECDQNHHFAAHSSSSSLDLWSYLLQWMWLKSSLCSTFLFFIFGSMKLLVAMNLIENVYIFGTMKFLVAINLTLKMCTFCILFPYFFFFFFFLFPFMKEIFCNNEAD